MVSIKNLKVLKYHKKKLWFFISFAASVAVKMKGYLKKKNQLKWLVRLKLIQLEQ